MRTARPLPDFDCYAELGVEPWADQDSIQRAWREGMRSVHPDATDAVEREEATRRAARLNVAREWLGDPRQRAEYDAVRWPRNAPPAPEIDPLGPWPDRPRAPRPPASIVPAIGLLASMGLLVAVLIGPGPGNLVGSALALLSLLVLGFAVTWTVVGVIRGR